MQIALYNDRPSSDERFREILNDRVLERLEALISRIRRKGLRDLDPNRNRLIRIGTETDSRGRVTKSGYGVFELSLQTGHHRAWASAIRSELDGIRKNIKDTHGVPLRFVIWVGMGGSAEDKSMYNAVGLLKRGPRCFVLDSTDPAKLQNILAAMSRGSRSNITQLLKSTLVVGMAMGMTSYEPVLNLEKLAALYDRRKINSRPNFLYLTLPGSLLDKFASDRGYKRVELQPDNRNTLAGRHSGPLTRGSLYPLALCGVDLDAWMQAANLKRSDIDIAFRLAASLHTQGAAGRDKVTLILPDRWVGAALWTKQDFEESLGKSDSQGIKIIIDEKIRLTNYRAPKEPGQDRVFLVVQLRGEHSIEPRKLALLRHAGYPVAVVILPAASLLSRYMQFVHYVVFALAYLRDMNFVTQPGVELYKSLASRLYSGAVETCGIENTNEWQAMRNSPHQAKWRGRLTLFYDRLAPSYDRLAGEEPCPCSAPEVYAKLLGRLAASHAIEYAELTFFGDSRYDPAGRSLRMHLQRAAESLFRSRLKMPADIYEGPAMNHSYHEMIIGHGKCFSTIVISDADTGIDEIDHTPDYHRAQFLATVSALAQRKRPVAAIALRDLEAPTLKALDEFFRQAARYLRNVM